MGVVVLWNSRNDHEDIATEIGLHLLDETQYPLDIAPKDRKGVTLDPGILDAYVGEYQTLEAQGVSAGLELKPGLILKVIREGGRLFAQPAGQKKVEILAGTERDFFWQDHDAKTSLRVEDASATFVRDERGHVTHLVLHWDGYHQPARKIN